MSENEKNYSEEKRNININSNSPEIMTNNIYTPAFLREQIGKLVRVEFLIGTNNLVDRVVFYKMLVLVIFCFNLLKVILFCIVIFILLNLLQFLILAMQIEIYIIHIFIKLKHKKLCLAHFGLSYQSFIFLLFHFFN